MILSTVLSSVLSNINSGPVLRFYGDISYIVIFFLVLLFSGFVSFPSVVWWAIVSSLSRLLVPDVPHPVLQYSSCLLLCIPDIVRNLHRYSFSNLLLNSQTPQSSVWQYFSPYPLFRLFFPAKTFKTTTSASPLFLSTNSHSISTFNSISLEFVLTYWIST